MLKHKQMIVSAKINYAPRDPDVIEAWLTMTIKYIGMNLAKGGGIVKNPQAYYCDMEGNYGVTGTAILETSHAALHIWDEVFPAKLEFDIYTCSELSPEDVKKMLWIFEPVEDSIQHIYIDREDGLKIIEGK